MNWDAIGAIGQVLGSVAVFVTLGYLAVQVRHARSEVRRSFAQDRVHRMIQMNMPIVADERVAELHAKVNESLLGTTGRLPPFLDAAMNQLGLTRAQAVSLNTELHVKWQSTVLDIEYLGEFSATERMQFDRRNRTNFAEPIFRFWYDLTKPFLNPDAVRYMDNLLV